jgi:hypothetical protein
MNQSYMHNFIDIAKDLLLCIGNGEVDFSVLFSHLLFCGTED